MSLTAEELLAGGSLTHTVTVPAEFLPSNGSAPPSSEVVLRPLTVHALQRIAKAAHDNETLTASLMIQQALVEPTLEFQEVAQLPAGLARFLVQRINSISGIDTPRDELAELVQAPLAKACFILAQEFGWTPEAVSGMTIGQILLYLEMSHSRLAAENGGTE